MGAIICRGISGVTVRSLMNLARLFQVVWLKRGHKECGSQGTYLRGMREGIRGGKLEVTNENERR